MPVEIKEGQIDDVAREAMSVFNTIESHYMNSGDALSDSIDAGLSAVLGNVELDDEVEDEEGNTEVGRMFDAVYTAIERLYPNFEVS